MIVNLVLFKYVCARNHEFTAPEISPSAYGEFLMRSLHSREEAYLNAISDEVFLEFGALVKVDEMTKELVPLEVGKMTQTAFSIACDTASDGSIFKIGLDPRCPLCGSEEMRLWSQVSPAQIVKRELRHVTHDGWGRLSLDEKKKSIRSELLKLQETRDMHGVRT